MSFWVGSGSFSMFLTLFPSSLLLDSKFLVVLGLAEVEKWSKQVEFGYTNGPIIKNDSQNSCLFLSVIAETVIPSFREHCVVNCLTVTPGLLGFSTGSTYVDEVFKKCDL